jgi:hypothetical protein
VVEREVMTCEWFLKCEKPAAGTVYHPVLGDVPTCHRCATMLDLDLVQWPVPIPRD